eukprot:13450699-Heterocapsa_arctica.AAC.1
MISSRRGPARRGRRTPPRSGASSCPACKLLELSGASSCPERRVVRSVELSGTSSRRRVVRSLASSCPA